MSDSRSSPWYIETFLALGGWFAGIIAAGAIFAMAISMATGAEDADIVIAVLMLVFGGICAFYGAMAGGAGGGDFLRHFSVSSVSAGLTAGAGGAWYLLFKALDTTGMPDSSAGGISGLGASVILAIAGFFLARKLRDAILIFLVTLAVYGLVIAACAIFEQGAGFGGGRAGIYVTSAAAALGVIVFINCGGAALARPASAAAMIGPAIHRLVLEQNLTLGLAGAGHWPISEVVFIAAALYALWRLRTRYSLAPLIASSAALIAGIWLLPVGGAIAILMLIAAFAANHRGLAVIGVLAAAWSISHFYYDLSLTLLEKSGILAGLGAIAIAGALFFRRKAGGGASDRAASTAPDRRLVASLAFGAVLAIAAGYINLNVSRLDAAFREGREIYLRLGPVDPRSLIQGDYMRLNYRNDIYPPFDAIRDLPRTGEVFLALDEDNVAQFSRIAAADAAPAANEIRIDYVKSSRQQMRYVPESFFFQEGEADIFAPASFAIVLVAPDGRARLVGLADAEFARLGPEL